ncbi:unnamed protein product [Schistosoma turkestanicum]|nr:unnamed protein product [Schistosoma turkestanicum]
MNNTKADKYENRRDKNNLYPIALSCITGLVHAYSLQTNEKFQLEDFTVILLGGFGLSSPNEHQLPTIPSHIIADYMIESFKTAQTNALLSSILFNYAIPRLCVPLLLNSCTNSNDHSDNSTKETKLNIDELVNWQSYICLLDKIFQTITEENLINALYYDKQTVKTLNTLKLNTYSMINKLQECLSNSMNLLTHSSTSILSDEKYIYFTICLCRLFYSLIKFTNAKDLSLSMHENSIISSDNTLSLYTSSVDSIFNIICAIIQWLDKISLINNNELLNYEVSKSVSFTYLSKFINAFSLATELAIPSLYLTVLLWLTVNHSDIDSPLFYCAFISTPICRDELLSFIPIIYESCDLFIGKLDQFLFDYLKNCQMNQITLYASNSFTMDILKYCSCKNLSLLQKTIDFILEKCNNNHDNNNNVVIPLDSEDVHHVNFQYWAENFTSLLYFVCESLIKNSISNNNNNNNKIINSSSIHSYLFELCQNVKYFISIINCYTTINSININHRQVEFISNEINKLNFIFRIITSQCNSFEQTKLFHIYKHYFDEADHDYFKKYPLSLGLFTILCGIIGGLRPECVNSENPIQLLVFMMNNIKKILCASSSAVITTTNTTNTNTNSLSVVSYCSTTVLSSIVQTYASVLNKSNDTFASDITEHLSTSLNYFWSIIEQNHSIDWHKLICLWIIWSMRGLLSAFHIHTPAMANSDSHNDYSHHKQWCDYLLQSILLKFDTTHTDAIDNDDDWICTFQKTFLSSSSSSHERILCSINCFKQADQILLDSMLNSIHCCLHSFNHCRLTDSYIQNVLQCIYEPIYNQIDFLINRTKSFNLIDFEKNILFKCFRNSIIRLYLNMTVRLPNEYLTDQLVNKIIPLALFAITSCSDIHCQLAGLKLISIILNENFIKNSKLYNIMSENQISDLLEKLPKLIDFVINDDEINTNLLLIDQENEQHWMKMSTYLRLFIARCLCRIVKLFPEPLINRYRDVTILPLLDQLVDDPNRYVRMEAVQARNLWLI